MNQSILMHANAGITFDLAAFRQTYGPLISFTALCGLSPSDRSETGNHNASFYVLLDGKEVLSFKNLMPQDDPKEIHVDLPSQNRYLTLITTQGSDGTIDNDLCVFMKPRIHIEKVMVME